MNKAKNTFITNLLIIAIAAVYCVLLVVGNVGVAKAAVAVIPGSYGAKYAEEKHLATTSLADSQQEYFDQRYELFDYSIDNRDKIVLEKYSGQSSDLVIPASIKGKDVGTLSADFMQSLGTVKNLYISNNIKSILGDPDSTIIIHSNDDNEFYRENQDSEEWKFERILDSDYVNFALGDIPFEFNNLGSAMEVTQYTGKGDYVIIPSYINGYPVTSVSLDFLDDHKMVVIPETVTAITGTSTKLIYSSLFAIELVFTLLAFVLALLTVNIFLPRYHKSITEYMLTGNQMAAVILYVLIQTGFSIYAIYYSNIAPYLALVISCVILIVLLGILFLGGVGRDHAKTVSESIAVKTSRMDALKESTKHMADSVKDLELKKQVQRLVDEIRYSDPVSRQDLAGIESEIEKAIDDVKATIAKGDSTEISGIVDDALKLVKERNDICKTGKK